MGDDQRWFLYKAEKEFGPFTANHLRHLFENGEIDQNDQVRRGEAGEWMPAQAARSAVLENTIVREACAAMCDNDATMPDQESRVVRAGRKLATSRQKEFARELGIEFPDEITRGEISKLIDVALAASDEKRYQRLDELSDRESDAWRKIRAEVLAEVDAEDCRLSKAEPKQIVEALSERGVVAILITMPWDDIEGFDDLTGVQLRVSFNDDMKLDDVDAVILQYAANVMRRKGIIK